MRTTNLILSSLAYYWRSNLAVVLGVGTAVSVLAGALLVGDSVRGSLRDLFEERLGRTDQVISATGFFREKLADDIQAEPRFSQEFGGVCPLIALTGAVSDQKNGRRAGGVQIYGVDDRFWTFHGLQDRVKTLSDRDVLLSPALARTLGGQPGDTLLLRIEKPTAIPAGSLLGRKDDLGRTIRLNIRETLAPSSLGEFSIRPGQGDARVIFVSLSRLQKDLEQNRAVNLILIKQNESHGATRTAGAFLGPHASSLPDPSALMPEILNDTCSLEDLGIKLRLLDQQRGVALESDRGVISDALYSDARAAADKAGVRLEPILSYLANSIRAGAREVPYSVVTGLSPERFAASSPALAPQDHSGEASVMTGPEVGATAAPLPPIILNDWTANDLQARTGDEVTLEYYIWEDQGVLSTHTARFRLAAVVPMKDQAADRDLVPDYPGITTTQNIADWDPPFPVDLRRVRPADEQYWHQYRTTPKAFVQLETAQRLWPSRYGKLTSVRLRPPANADPGPYLESLRQDLRASLHPVGNGLSVTSVRTEGLEASHGATDFGEYFSYFSFFLVIGALLLASLFFKLGVEQRLREIGTLRAVGFAAQAVRSLFMREGLVLAVAGSIFGVAGALGYGSLIMYGLRTWWIGAVGTTALRLHLSVYSLVAGAAGGTIIAVLCIIWTLRTLATASPAGLLTGNLEAAMQSGSGAHRRRRLSLHTRPLSVGLAIIGLGLLVLAALGVIGKTPGFFGAGTALLLALLLAQHAWLNTRDRRVIDARGWWSISRLGFRNATYRAGRSILCIALIASAAFIIVAVESFKQGPNNSSMDRKSGTGGFPLLAESQLPLYHDPGTPEGRDALNLVAQKGFDPDSVVFQRFRVRAGDDASCLNLYQPRDPRILGASDEFIRSGRFSFQESLAKTKEEKENPWLLLTVTLPDGAIPVIADANSMTYVLHRKLGDDVVLNQASGGSVRLRLVAALSDSIFQGELLMTEANFLSLFPDQGGYSFFLLDVAPQNASMAASALDQQLADFGFDVIPAPERLAAFHRVENTYLSTFEALGGLGLVLGTLGLAAVLLRNVLERRRELGLLRAIGYNSGHFALMVIAENAVLVYSGIATGALCALVAIGPAFLSRGGHFPAVSLWMLLLVLVTGLFASLAATLAALRMPLLAALRAE
jgi:ABC-type lipoprotein release transport system permease subunit